MLDKYRGAKAAKPYLIFSLTDETYSLVCSVPGDIPREMRIRYSLLVSLFDHAYWVAGTVLGVTLGSVFRFNTEGMDFALTALIF